MECGKPLYCKATRRGSETALWIYRKTDDCTVHLVGLCQCSAANMRFCAAHGLPDTVSSMLVRLRMEATSFPEHLVDVGFQFTV
jgi:hypothetical protein